MAEHASIPHTTEAIRNLCAANHTMEENIMYKKTVLIDGWRQGGPLRRSIY